MATISRLYKDHDTGARVVAELEGRGFRKATSASSPITIAAGLIETDRSGSIGMPMDR